MDPDAARETASQLAHPTGEGGLAITTVMNKANAFITARCLDALALVPGDHLVEVGPGNGLLSRDAVATLGEAGRYLGLEYHDDMAAVAAETFSDCSTTTEVRAGDFLDHAPDDRGFDALLAVNVLYFFDDLDEFAGRCRDWLRPGGRGAIGVRSVPAMSALPFVDHGFRLRPLDEILRAFHGSGFESIRAHYFDEGTTELGDLTIAVDSVVISATAG